MANILVIDDKSKTVTSAFVRVVRGLGLASSDHWKVDHCNIDIEGVAKEIAEQSFDLIIIDTVNNLEALIKLLGQGRKFPMIVVIPERSEANPELETNTTISSSIEPDELRRVIAKALTTCG